LHVLAAVVVTQRLEGFVAALASICAPATREVPTATARWPGFTFNWTAVFAVLHVRSAAMRTGVVPMVPSESHRQSPALVVGVIVPPSLRQHAHPVAVPAAHPEMTVAYPVPLSLATQNEPTNFVPLGTGEDADGT
jgi:hypothetical protein